MEATAGFEPTNRGFAVPPLKPLEYVALFYQERKRTTLKLKIPVRFFIGAEEEI